MAKLHELLAAEKTPTAAWGVVSEETLKKMAKPESFFQGHTRSLTMIEDNPANKALEAAAREVKAMPSNVFETLDYALDIFVKAEDLQVQKNATNRLATGDVMWNGDTLLPQMPVDELLGLEDRLKKILQIVQAMPTLDASKLWVLDPQAGRHIYRLAESEKTTKTEKVMAPVILAPPTDKHPAQVAQVNKDIVVGTFQMMKTSGEATAVQKADAIQIVNQLLIEVKQARMRANMADVVDVHVGVKIKNVILSAFAAGTT